MKQETANIWFIVVGLVNVIALLFYSFQTWKMQLAVTNQSKDLSHQVKLSILPAFVVEFVNDPDLQVQLRNVGNGAAIDILPDEVVFHWVNENAKVFEPLKIAFDKVTLLRTGEDVTMKHTSYGLTGSEMENRSLVSRLTEECAGDKVFELKVHFRDIEGTEYKQTIFMGKGGIRPTVVESVHR